MSMGITDRNVAKALCLSPGSHELLSQLRDEDIAKVYLINEELDAAMEEQVMLSAKFEVARDGTEQAMAGWDESREQLRRARAAEAIARSAWQNQVKKERTLVSSAFESSITGTPVDTSSSKPMNNKLQNVCVSSPQSMRRWQPWRYVFQSLHIHQTLNSKINSTVGRRLAESSTYRAMRSWPAA